MNVQQKLDYIKHLNSLDNKPLRRATKQDYDAFIRTWLTEHDIDEINFYDTTYNKGNIYVVYLDCQLPDRYGAESYDVIVPAGISVTFVNGRDIGHGEVYRYNPLEVLSFHGKRKNPTVYNDTI